MFNRNKVEDKQKDKVSIKNVMNYASKKQKPIISESKLKVHITEVHFKIKTNKCELCGMEFSRKWVLTQHMKKLHENDCSRLQTNNFCF